MSQVSFPICDLFQYSVSFNSMIHLSTIQQTAYSDNQTNNPKFVFPQNHISASPKSDDPEDSSLLVPVRLVEYTKADAALRDDRWALLKKKNRKNRDANIRLSYYDIDTKQKQNVRRGPKIQ